MLPNEASTTRKIKIYLLYILIQNVQLNTCKVNSVTHKKDYTKLGIVAHAYDPRSRGGSRKNKSSRLA